MSGGGNFGISTAIQVLQNIQQAIVGLSNVITKITAILASNNTWTGINTFSNTTDFTGPANFTNTAAFSGTTAFTGQETFDPPPNIIAGGTSATFVQPAGLISNQLSLVGIGNGADTTDDILFTYPLPANAFDNIGRSMVIEAFGTFAANTHNKTVKLFFGTATWYTSGVVTQNATGWYIRACISKVATNTHLGMVVAFGGAALLSQIGVGNTAQADASPIVISVTGASPTTGAASDVVANGMTITFMN